MITMYIAVQFRLMVLSFVIFLSFFWLSIKIFLYLKCQAIFYLSVFNQHLKHTLEELYELKTF